MEMGQVCWISDPSTSYIIHARSIRSLKAKMTDSPLGTFVMGGYGENHEDSQCPDASRRQYINNERPEWRGGYFVSDPRFDGALMSSLKNDGRIDVRGESYLVCSYKVASCLSIICLYLQKKFTGLLNSLFWH